MPPYSNKPPSPGTINQKRFGTLRENTAVTHCADVNLTGHEEYKNRNICLPQIPRPAL